MSKAIPFHDFGGDGPLLHFSAPNAYTPQTFRQFIEPFLTHYHVISSLHRPLWSNEPAETLQGDWDCFADDLISFLDQQGLSGVIGMGHSLGGVATIYAAHKRPDLFSQLVLLDPVFLPPQIIDLAKANPDVSANEKMVRQALRRKDRWDTRQEVFDRYREKRAFSRWSDEAIWDFVNYALREDEGTGEVTLAWPREWEARIYSMPPKRVWKVLPQLGQPTLAVRAAESDTLFPIAWAHWQQLQPTATFVEIADVGHMMMMERPFLVAQTVLSYLRTDTK